MSDLTNKINSADVIVVSGHIRPDGDCAGSVTAIYNYITENYKEKKVYLVLEKIPESILKCIDEPQYTDVSDVIETPDLFISLDCSSPDRLGAAEELFNKSKFRVVIDHHKTNVFFGNMNIVEPESSSASEVLFKLLDFEKISLKTAKSIYLGIVHDTGVFKYSCTSCETMKIAGRLLSVGVDSASIIDESFYSKTWKQNKVLAAALNNAELSEDGFIAYSVLSSEDMNKLEATPADTDGVVEQIRLTDGVEVALFIREDEKNLFKISMRAKTGIIDVSEIARKYGGGGHKMAAGFMMEGFAEEVTARLINEINGLRQV